MEIDMQTLLACLVVGYAFGMFLTAEVVARCKMGESAFDVGTGNPGMANIGHVLGAKAAAVVLAGDLSKVIAACLVASVLAGGWSVPVVGWTGVGAALGHLFPAWHRFRGGKGVAAGCAAMCLAWPLGGTLSLVAGLAVLVAIGYLGVAAVVIAAGYCALAALWGPAGLLGPSLVLLVLCLVGNGASCARALRGEERRSALYLKLHGKR